MRRMVLTALCSALTLLPCTALAQDRSSPRPLEDFVRLFTDDTATTAQKEVGLQEGAYYQGTITVSDVQLYTAKGKGERMAEIKDWNLDESCYVLLLRTPEVEKALELKKGDRVAVRARFAEMGLHVTKYVMECETYYALFKEGEIIGVEK